MLLDDLFLENGIRKEVRDRERILKEGNDYHEPYRSYIRRLVED